MPPALLRPPTKRKASLFGGDQLLGLVERHREAFQHFPGHHLPETAAHAIPIVEQPRRPGAVGRGDMRFDQRSEEHTSELQSLMRISYAVFCLKKQNKSNTSNSMIRQRHTTNTQHTY